MSTQPAEYLKSLVPKGTQSIQQNEYIMNVLITSPYPIAACIFKFFADDSQPAHGPCTSGVVLRKLLMQANILETDLYKFEGGEDTPAVAIDVYNEKLFAAWWENEKLGA